MDDDATFQERWTNRKSGGPILLHNCRMMSDDSWDVRFSVHIDESGRISAIDLCYPDKVEALATNPRVLDCQGLLLMPGLCDAHVHATAFTADLPAMLQAPESLTTAHSTAILRGMLMRGFTTVRDCGGADWGLASAIEQGLIMGPRLLFTGHALSQTGGHGDMRGKGEDCFACGAALRGIGRVCDGDAEVRRAARDELRKGAHCIKIMASGGVSSPTDRLTNTQFSLGEVRAIVDEAKAAGTYVCAHAYTAEAIERAIECGVRSIEHGNYLDEKTAKLMSEKGGILVPTLVTYSALRECGEQAGMKPELVQKVGDLVESGLRSLKIASEAGVTMCFGSDLLGALHSRQLEEFAIRGKVLPARQVVEAATINCAKLFGMEGQIGEFKLGCFADLILVDGNPYQDVACMEEHNIKLVMKEGVVVKNTLPKPGNKRARPA